MADQSGAEGEGSRPVSGGRALVALEEPRRAAQAAPAPSAAFLATLIAGADGHETARRRRVLRPAQAIARYSAGDALADEPATATIRTL